MKRNGLLHIGYRVSPLVLLLAAGCTTVPNDLGRGDVNGLLIERGVPVENQ